MPTYEYVCLSCGTHVEVFQRFADEPLTVCAVCGGQLRKVFHPAGIMFKGSGFYSNDSRKGSSSKVAASANTGSDGSKGSSAKESTGSGSEPSSSSSGSKGPEGSSKEPSSSKPEGSRSSDSSSSSSGNKEKSA